MEAHSVPVTVSAPQAPVSAVRSKSGAITRVNERDGLGRRALAVADLVAATFSLIVCISVVGHDKLRMGALLGVLIVIPIGKISGLYDRDHVLIHRTTIDEAPRIFHLATLYALVVWLLGPVLTVGVLGRDQMLGLWLTFAGSALTARFAARWGTDRLQAPERCLIIGEPEAMDQLNGAMARNERAVLVGRIDQEAWNERVSYEHLSAVVEEHQVDRLIIAPDDGHPKTVLDLIRAAKGLGVRVSILPRVMEVVGSNIEFDNFGGVPLLGVRPFRLPRSSVRIKRAFDFLCAGLALLLLAPVMIVVAVAIKLDSRGPLFFRQTRMGRDEKPFAMLKFRTMVPDAEELKAALLELNEADGMFKMADDPRITRVGRLLRRTSLDELPQLINVLRGDMSLVGPRPLILDEDQKISGFDRRRLELKPGMTGHWQILGSARVPLGEMLKIDYLYVAGWSLWVDIKLLLRTIPYVLARRGQ